MYGVTFTKSNFVLGRHFKTHRAGAGPLCCVVTVGRVHSQQLQRLKQARAEELVPVKE